MNLKSRSELRSQQSKIMDFIDVDQAIEVPDTPDRLKTATHNNNICNIRRRNVASVNNHIVNKDYTNEIMKSQPREKVKPVTVNGKPTLFTHPDSCSSPQAFQSFKNPRPTIDTTRHDKGKSLCNSDVQKSTRHVGGSFSGLIENNTSRKGVFPVNSFPAMDRSNKSCTLNNSPSFDRGKGVVFKAGNNPSAFMQPCTSFKVPRKKMLVRNGCISPHNIAKTKEVELKHETVSKGKEVQSGSGTVTSSDGGSSMVDIKDLIAEPNAGSPHLSHRRLIFKPLAESSSDVIIDINGWRTTHNHRKQGDTGQQNNMMMQRDHRNERDTNHLKESVIVSSPRVHNPPQTISPHAHKLGINRQRQDSASKVSGKRSISCIDESAGEPSTSRSKRNKGLAGVGRSNPVSEPNCNNEDSSFRALQIEADEMLARELQEQLYDEDLTPAVQIHEMDTPLAFAMPPQQDNRSRSAGGSHTSRRRGASNHSFRRLPQSRPTRMAQLRSHHRAQRNSIFPPNMDVDLRLEIPERLEAALNLRMPSEFLPLGREFNEDDYEMLLALDDNNHRHGGATRAQINNLPESTVQAENLQECSICLETPTIGETIRHLPCLHRFHKECIDQWLKRKTLCPVCKSSVTQSARI